MYRQSLSGWRFLLQAAQALAAAYEHDPDSAKHLPISYDAGVIYEC